MKKIIIYTCLCVAAAFTLSCSKSKVTNTPPVIPNNPNPPNPPANPTGYFFENTEWTGVAATYGQTYQQPCYLRFNGDSTVSIYALFNWIIGGGLVAVDSIVGTVTGIDVTSTSTTINVNFPFTNDQQIYTIIDQNKLQGGSASSTSATYYTSFSMQMQLSPNPAPSIIATSWKTDKMTGGPTDGMYQYPDINDFDFGADGNTSYVRNGKIITYTPPDIQKILYSYAQVGPKIYFAGYDETTDKLIGYFGILSPDGNTLFADTRNRLEARLPNYVQTIYWYGPPGSTPVTHKIR